MLREYVGSKAYEALGIATPRYSLARIDDINDSVVFLQEHLPDMNPMGEGDTIQDLSLSEIVPMLVAIALLGDSDGLGAEGDNVLVSQNQKLFKINNKMILMTFVNLVNLNPESFEKTLLEENPIIMMKEPFKKFIKTLLQQDYPSYITHLQQFLNRFDKQNFLLTFIADEELKRFFSEEQHLLIRQTMERICDIISNSVDYLKAVLEQKMQQQQLRYPIPQQSMQEQEWLQQQIQQQWQRLQITQQILRQKIDNYLEQQYQRPYLLQRQQPVQEQRQQGYYEQCTQLIQQPQIRHFNLASFYNHPPQPLSDHNVELDTNGIRREFKH